MAAPEPAPEAEKAPSQGDDFVDDTGDNDADDEDDNADDDADKGESKKARKKRERKEASRQKLKDGRKDRQQAQRKKQRLERDEERVARGDAAEEDDPREVREKTEEEKAEIRELRAQKKANELWDFKARCDDGTTVVLDLEWENQMSEGELKSLVQQVLYCYGANRKASQPVRLVLSGVAPGSTTHEKLAKQSGFESWPITVLAGPYIDAFKKEQLVYLTADSETVVEDFGTEKVYVIGGIVDRNRLKGVTREKADEQGIAAAQLPIARHIDMGVSSRVLTVNHVLQIILEYQGCKDWRTALDRGIPGRKKFVDEAEGKPAEVEAKATEEPEAAPPTDAAMKDA